MAVNFNATNQQITTTNIPLNGLSACSFMCTVDNVSTSNAYIFSQADGTGTTNTDFSFHIGNGKKVNARLNIAGTTSNISTGGGISTASTTLCATYDGSTFRLYVDGVLQASTNRTGTITTNAARIFTISGYFNNPAGWPWLGIVNDVRIYNRAFSDNEVLAYQESGGRDGIYGGLLAWYQLNEAPEGSTIATNINGSVRDHGPNRYNGKTSTASPTWTNLGTRRFNKSRLTGT